VHFFAVRPSISVPVGFSQNRSYFYSPFLDERRVPMHIVWSPIYIYHITSAERSDREQPHAARSYYNNNNTANTARAKVSARGLYRLYHIGRRVVAEIKRKAEERATSTYYSIVRRDNAHS